MNRSITTAAYTATFSPTFGDWEVRVNSDGLTPFGYVVPLRSGGFRVRFLFGEYYRTLDCACLAIIRGTP